MFLLIVIFVIIIIFLLIYILKHRRVEKILKEKNEELKKNQDLLRKILNTIPNPVFYKNMNYRYVDVNDAYLEHLGFKKEDIINQTVFDINQGELAQSHHKLDVDLIRNSKKQTYEAKVIYADGLEHDVLFCKAAVSSEHKGVEGIVGVMLDITERKKIENRVSRLLKVNEAMLEVNHYIIGMDNIKFMFDLILEKAIGIIESARFGSVLILTEDDNLEITAFKGYNSDKAKEFSLPVKQSFLWYKTKGRMDRTVIINKDDMQENDKGVDMVANTQGVEIKSNIIAPIIIKGKLYGELSIDSEFENAFNEEDIEILEHLRSKIEIAISKHKMYKEIMYLSKYDKLTNVYNRRHFEDLFDEQFNQALRCDGKFHFVVFDLNGLKLINDTYGHLAGDEYIRTFAGRLSSAINSPDFFARYGGDEFVAVFLKEDYTKLREKLESIIAEFKAEPIIFEGNRIICSFSFGIAAFPNDAKTYEQLVKVADERMYKYKEEYKKRLLKINQH
ncbi:sensor domain-containing diguanylate cyclase [Oceanirhabdus sp. W0125-5]|uniref:sensor domain-containing diguanylate cyclase n=1 Tax=Oceanirhabdus sp. W0125-5 TaxID=2999116 RepID=UPI0022F2AF62|nr:diguanylate cyclase [Oceanirhabdus sp. W0125-5]WBW95366.1 diguanylate cyclase [Oceanirhabdus sp. W0125-5]